MTLSAKPAIDRADQLLVIATRLIALVGKEIEALKARRLDGGSQDFEEKERLAHAWRLEVSQIKADPTLLAGARPDQKAALRDMSQKLEELLEGHARELAAMKQVSEGLVRAIADEIASVRQAPPGYGRSGAIQSGRAASSSGLAVNAKA
ncbi:MAG: flagellar basal-body protein FlbY [Alphaproteobacteria bacterium]|nr:flagellar basal-body protein FlbY [Alphaproteobacteria bacterium]